MVENILIGLAIFIVLLVATFRFACKDTIKRSYKAGKAAAEADMNTKQTQQLKR